MLRRFALVLVALTLALGAGGCGSGDTEDLRSQARERAQRIEREFRERREELRQRGEEITARIRARVKRVLDQMKQAIPAAERTDPQVRSRGNTRPRTIDEFLTAVLRSIDRYWTRTLRASGLPEPRVGYVWIPPGQALESSCGPAGASAAFYCPTDDTIYVAQQFASELYQGVARGLPGESAGYGHAAGDFGVAYVLAHEYGHNVQHELGLFTLRPGTTVEPFELQADCFAGAWGNSVYEEGLVTPEDVQEAINTALAVGDFDTFNAQHHGTPPERRAAWLTGFDSGDPSVCQRYVPTG